MNYCGPWKEDHPDFWTLRDMEGFVIGLVYAPHYRVPYGTLANCIIDEYNNVEEGKRKIENYIRGYKKEGDWVILKDERLRVML